MQTHTLNKEDTRAFLEATCLGQVASALPVKSIIEDAQSWQRKVDCLSFFAAIFIERYKHGGGDCTLLIENMYKLPSEMFFSLNECGPDFICYLLRHTRGASFTFATILSEIQAMYSDYDYSRTIRM